MTRSVFESPLQLRDTLIEYLRAEAELEQREEVRRQGLSAEALVDEGWAIADLTFTAGATGRLYAFARENTSRIRAGDRLELTSCGIKLETEVASVSGNALELIPRKADSPVTELLLDGRWFARVVSSGIANLVRLAIERLQPGAPGWAFVRRLCEQQGSGDEDEAATECEVVDRALAMPPLLAVQGPPGTGKTARLADVAARLSVGGKRVLIVAPTHQAVDNALAAVARADPTRRVVKVDSRSWVRSDPDSAVETLDFDDGARRSDVKVNARTVTGMTVAAAIVNLVLRRSALAPHVVFVDEAGQLPLSHGSALGGIGAGSVLLFGDDLQMPPVVAAPLASSPVSVSLFKRARECHPHSVLVLRETYRLNDVLCGAVSRAFYEPNGVCGLYPSREAHGRRIRVNADFLDDLAPELRPALESDASLVTIKTPSGGSTQSNLISAQIAARLVAAFLRSGGSPADVAVVVPYRRQAALVRSLLDAKAPLPVVDTVERVQGATVDMVVVDLVVDDPGSVRDRAAFILQPNRLNVAVSRARKKAIIIMSQAVGELLSQTGLTAWMSLRRLIESSDLEIGIGSSGFPG